MAYKVKNLTKDPRKFRIHKTAEAFFIRSGEEIVVSHKPIISNFNIFSVKDLSKSKTDELNEVEEIGSETFGDSRPKKKRTIKLGDK